MTLPIPYSRIQVGMKSPSNWDIWGQFIHRAVWYYGIANLLSQHIKHSWNMLFSHNINMGFSIVGIAGHGHLRQHLRNRSRFQATVSADSITFSQIFHVCYWQTWSMIQISVNVTAPWRIYIYNNDTLYVYGYRYYIMYILAHRNSKSLRDKWIQTASWFISEYLEPIIVL